MGEGNVAVASLELMATVSVAVTEFQFASTEFTVTVNGVPAIWEAGLPVFPLEVPGAALSPGAKIWSLAKLPAETVMPGLVEV